MKRTAEELGAIVRDRRLALGGTQVQVIEAARIAGGATVSEPTMRSVEKGRTEANDLTLASISRGLDWPPDALRKIRDGELAPEALAPTGEGAGDQVVTIMALASEMSAEDLAAVEAYMRGRLGR